MLHSQPSCYPDKAVRRDVGNLEVQCNNQKLGCKWIGRLVKYFEVNCRPFSRTFLQTAGQIFQT